MSALIEGRVALQDFTGLVACGGFSYGDVLGAGRGWATSILERSALHDEPAEEHHPRCRALAAVPPQCQRAVRSPHRAAGGGGVAVDPVARHGRVAPAGGGGAWRRPGGV
ncbi:hypothetical protein G6F55_014117 [Rhizopus delemar]|nr:hypothetical protein G6F55_014117 [Rhizopus delemar]